MLKTRKEIFEAIEEERKKQIMGEGYFPSHDDLLVNEELAMAASVYAHPMEGRHLADWPFGEKRYHPLEMERQKELVKAAALIVAEIERLGRAGIR